MATTTGTKHRVWFLTRGMTLYVSRIYKSEKYEITSSDIAEEDLYLPKRLKITLVDSLDRFKDERYVKAHNHCVEMENRVEHVKNSFRTGLLEIAKSQPHDKFLHECTLYILSATEMAQLNFVEAIDIVTDAIYYACMNTEQHESLLQWGTEGGRRENSAINGSSNPTSGHNNEVKPNNDAEHCDDSQNNADTMQAEIDVGDSDIEISVD